ncbi:MAG: glycosyltransferase [Candidatus Dadabacteria bacterium]|nr:MAG: glycosyltransferase [Candidatus Dadabacteria bacterium]
MLTTGYIENDSRVLRAATSLSDAGFEVLLASKSTINGEKLPFKVCTIDLPFGRIYRALRALFSVSRQFVYRLTRRADTTANKQNSISETKILRHQPLPILKLKSALYNYLAAQIVKKYQPDIIHAHDFYPLRAAYTAWAKYKIPYVYDSHELWLERNRVGRLPDTKITEWEEAEEKRGIKNAAFSITVCRSIAESLKERYGIPMPLVIRNIPCKKSSAPQQKAAKDVKALLGVSPNDFLAVYIGKATFHRGIFDILRALPSLSEEIKFAVIGYFDPEFLIEYNKEIEILGIKDRVFRYGPVPPSLLLNTIRGADVSLVTMNAICKSYYFTLPNKLFESIIGGLPVIATDLPEMRALIEKYQCGLLYQDGDSKSLAHAIKTLAKDPLLARTLAANSVKAANKLDGSLEQAKMVEAYYSIFKPNAAQNGKAKAQL